MKWFAGNELSVDDLYKGNLPEKQYQQRLSLLIMKRHAKVLKELDLGFEWKLVKTPVANPAEKGEGNSNSNSLEPAEDEQIPLYNLSYIKLKFLRIEMN